MPPPEPGAADDQIGRQQALKHVHANVAGAEDVERRPAVHPDPHHPARVGVQAGGPVHVGQEGRAEGDEPALNFVSPTFQFEAGQFCPAFYRFR
jgi:hypothetical protein